MKMVTIVGVMVLVAAFGFAFAAAMTSFPGQTVLKG
jgi:ABC-type Fe3+ transport system permease subunit